MGRHDSNPESKPILDYKQIAEGADEMREMLRALVAAVKAEGFDDKQARAIVAGIMGIKPELTGDTGD